MLLGSHVSMSGKTMLEGAAKEAASYGSTTFMIYSGAPQNTRRKAPSEMRIEEGHTFMEEHGMSQIVLHAPYIVNLGNVDKPEQFEFGVQFMKEEVKRADALNTKQMTYHPGAHVGAGPQAAIEQIAQGFNQFLSEDQEVSIALETMAGKGTEIGRSFDELAAIIDRIDLKDKVSVTLDTCHCHDAGYPIREDFDGVLEEFDRIIGLDYLKVIHINDSKNEQGAKKDRHENIGFGEIGFEALNYIVHHPQLKELPKILETPYLGEDKKNKKAPYAHEIHMLKMQTFIPTLKEDIMSGIEYN